MAALLDHETATQGVLDTASAVAASPNITEGGLSALLRSKGYSPIQAEKLTTFVPSAFAWVLLHKMGASLPNHYIALTKDGAEVSIPIAQEHYFTAALALAHHTFQNGWSAALPRSTFEAVANRSAEMDAVNKLLNQGETVSGASVQPFRVFGFTAEAAREG